MFFIRVRDKRASITTYVKEIKISYGGGGSSKLGDILGDLESLFDFLFIIVME